jgi:hypothetical protein
MCKCSSKCNCNITQLTKGEKGDANSDATLGYKVYVALLTQTGTDAPVATILQNTLGVVPTWSYEGVGEYQLNQTGLFTLNKTIVLLGGVTGGGDTLVTDVGNVNYFYISTSDETDNLANDLLSKTTIEIRVYP